jgi:hypothetical protein
LLFKKTNGGPRKEPKIGFGLDRNFDSDRGKKGKGIFKDAK